MYITVPVPVESSSSSYSLVPSRTAQSIATLLYKQRFWSTAGNAAETCTCPAKEVAHSSSSRHAI